jgi:hypothetical protein
MIYQEVLGTIVCRKMRRAWRNRSNVTQGEWCGYARQILGESTDALGTDAPKYTAKFAACLYVACGWYAARCGSEVFDGTTIPPQGWNLIQAMTEDFIVSPPDRALTRGAWEDQRQRAANTRKFANKMLRRRGYNGD